MIGEKKIRFDTVTSTNDFLKQNKANLDHGTVVSASVQTKGRGRKERTWMSQKGNLYFSFLLTKDIAYKDLARILFQTSISIIKVLEEYGVKADIKYPNDIIVNKKKIGGILIETSGGQALDSICVGVGINVMQENFPNLETKAISMVNVLHKQIDLQDLMNRFINTYNILEEETLSYIHGCYIKYSMVIGREIQIDGQRASIKDVTRSGYLVVEIDGEDHIYEDHEISLEELYENSQS